MVHFSSRGAKSKADEAKKKRTKELELSHAAAVARKVHNVIPLADVRERGVGPPRPVVLPPPPPQDIQSRKRAASRSPPRPTKKVSADRPQEERLQVAAVVEDRPSSSFSRSSFIFPSTQDGVVKLAREISAVPPLHGINFSGTRHFPEELVGNGIISRIGRSRTTEELGKVHCEQVTGRLGCALAEIAAAATVLDSRATRLYSERDKLREEVKAEAAKAQELAGRVEQLTAEVRSLKELVSSQELTIKTGREKLSSAHSELGQAARLSASLQNKLDFSLKESKEQLASLMRQQITITDLEEEVARLKANDGDAIAASAVEAFKVSDEIRELHIEFARPIFEAGKLHVCRVAAAHGSELGDLVQWACEDQYSALTRYGHALVPYNDEGMEDLREVDADIGDPLWVPPFVYSPNVVSLLEASNEGELPPFDPTIRLAPFSVASTSEVVVAAETPLVNVGEFPEVAVETAEAAATVDDSVGVV